MGQELPKNDVYRRMAARYRERANDLLGDEFPWRKMMASLYRSGDLDGVPLLNLRKEVFDYAIRSEIEGDTMEELLDYWVDLPRELAEYYRRLADDLDRKAEKEEMQ